MSRQRGVQLVSLDVYEGESRYKGRREENRDAIFVAWPASMIDI